MREPFSRTVSDMMRPELGDREIGGGDWICRVRHAEVMLGLRRAASVSSAGFMRESTRKLGWGA